MPSKRKEFLQFCENLFTFHYRLRFKGTLGTQAYCLPLLPEGRRPYILPDHSRPIQVVVDPAITDPGTLFAYFSDSQNFASLLTKKRIRMK